MPLQADLYVEQIDFARYADTKTCQVCRVDSLSELLERLRSGQVCPGQCPHWPRARVEAFQTAVNAGRMLPTIPSLEVPRPAHSGWFGLNGSAADSPALITGNSQLTHEVLLAVLSTMTTPLWLVAVDTGGHTVDMSLVYGTLTAAAIAAAVEAADSPAHDSRRAAEINLPADRSRGREASVSPASPESHDFGYGKSHSADRFTGRIILPGLAAGLAVPLSRILARPAEVGPICAAELPLFFAAECVR